MTHQRERGREAEYRARHFLTKRGLIHVRSNYQCRFGEIDLIMDDGEFLVFVEVRLRSNRRYGGALESIDMRKQSKLRLTAQHYLQRFDPSANRPARFDVVLLGSPVSECEWIKNAF